mmetsp:Transcript_17726/g.20939  ORF Transcript_17726/g.20939 Transcript_17726/m.20939 type:complete len:101 (-) Transcript_17726:67-369(-)
MAYVKYRWSLNRHIHDLIILDAELMTSNGIQTAIKIRQFLAQNGHRVKDRPYICLLNSSSRQEGLTKEEQERFGINTCMSQPIFREGILTLLREADILPP